MRLFKLLLAVTALACFASAVSGVQSIHTGANGALVVTRHGEWGRIAVGLAGTFALACLVAVQQRMPLAWKLGWAILVVSIAQAVLNLVLSPLPGAMKVFGGVGVALVGVYWGRWWRRQRIYFDPTQEPVPVTATSIPISRLLLLGVGAYLILAVVMWFGLGSLNLSRYRRLATEGVPVEATVTATECHNHGVVRYKFQADGHTFAGIGQPGAGNPSCDALKAGDQLAVWYVPADPTVNRPGDPTARLENEEASVWIASTIMPAFLVAIVVGVRILKRVVESQSTQQPVP